MNPLSVAVAIVEDSENILLIQRNGGTFTNMWALPGGKVEFGEHVREAIIREIQEEASIQCTFKEHLGVVDELLFDGEEKKHFLLHICLLHPEQTEITSSDEGTLEWFSSKQIEKMKDKIIPSDYKMIEHFGKKKKTGYIESIVRQNKDGYALEKFQ